MNVSSSLARIAVPSMFFALVGCGGGGTNSASIAPPPTAPSTPTPTPVTPAGLSPSTAFSAAMQSGTFVSIPSTAGTYVSYDAPSNTYRLNVPATAANSFTSGATDPTEASYRFDYSGTANWGSNTYLLTHTGNGPFVYSYTAVASIHSDTNSWDGSHSVADNLAVFGMPTAASAVPRTGSASYALDMLGTYKGTGTGSVNFGAGSYAFSGTFVQGSISGTFQSSGTLASASNGFSGTLNLSMNQGAATFSGPLGGMFFGPAAQELGGTFVAAPVSSNGTLGTNVANNPVVGAILGHR